MTTTQSTQPPVRSQTSSARSIPILIAAAVLVVAVVVAVLLFAVARPPELASLTDVPDPAPAGPVAWSGWGEDDWCLSVARTDGRVDELTCAREGGEVQGWDDDGILIWSYGPRDELVVIDPDTGEELDRRDVDPEDLGRPLQDEWVSSRYRDGVLTVTRRGADVPVWEVEAPEGYSVEEGMVSPDGAWVAMFDSEERLLLAPADGSAEPRVWAEGTSRWGVPVWEGTPGPGEDA